MKKVIALWGCSNVGKSSTIKQVCELLLAKYPKTKKEHGIFRVDIRVVLIINGVKVGIESQGDPGSRLSESLSLFAKMGCKVIVCATRTKGQTVDAVNKLKPNYEVIWREQIATKSANWESNNLEMAKWIVKKVENIIQA
ncbi:MAG: hypothetical protein JXA96_08375 [Sedimentisphaerales bacterium]|nr:hypothetical protein [Sedimentisphaerales bacterium]